MSNVTPVLSDPKEKALSYAVVLVSKGCGKVMAVFRYKDAACEFAKTFRVNGSDARVLWWSEL